MISAAVWVNITLEKHLLWQCVPPCSNREWDIWGGAMQKGQWRYWCSSGIQHCWVDVATLTSEETYWKTLKMPNFPQLQQQEELLWWISAQDRAFLSTKQCITSFQVTIFHRDFRWENQGRKRPLPLISAAIGCSGQPSHTCVVWIHLLRRKRGLCWPWESKKEMEMGSVALLFCWFLQ